MEKIISYEMNKFKSFLLGIFILSFMFFGVQVFAQENQVPPGGTLVATVNVDEASIVSQDGNTFNISFTLSNREGLQTGLKYGIQLFRDNDKAIVDEKVYDEMFTIYEYSTFKKEISYVAPSLLNGNYTLLLVIKNESGFSFGVISLGKANLKASTKGINILNESCYLQVVGEKGSPHYALTKVVDINEEENLRLTCSAINETNTSVSITPTYESRYFSAYGKISPQTGGDNSIITFLKNERKTFSLVLPKGDIPQFYGLKIGFVGEDILSNNIFMRYIISGVSTNIQKLSLDKDYYKRGESGELNIVLLVLHGNFSRSNESENILPIFSVNTKVLNENGNECTKPISKKLGENFQSPNITISLNFKRDCLNPHVFVTVTDDVGKIFDQKDFTFKSNPNNKNPKSFNPIYSIFVLGSIVLLIGLRKYTKHKKI